MKILTWRGRGGRQRLCCRVLASPLTSPTVNLPNKHAQDVTVYCPIPEFTLWWYDGFALTSNFTVWLGFRHHHLLHHTTPEHSVKLLCMPPKPACHVHSLFSLLSLLLCLFFSSSMHVNALSHSLSHSLTLPATHSLSHSLSTRLLAHSSPDPLTHTHALAAQPLRVVTEDTCLFHYLVPAPMSPSNKSVGSDAGSQDSGDGNAGPRSVNALWVSCAVGLCLHASVCVFGLISRSSLTEREGWFVRKEE